MDSSTRPIPLLSRYAGKAEDHVALVDADDYDSIAAWTWIYEEKRGYAVRVDSSEEGHFARRMQNDILPQRQGYVVDSINKNPLDCRRSNLRYITRIESNRRKSPASATGYKGVTWDSSHNAYTARIEADGKIRRLGRFSTAEDAARAYDEAARALHGAYAYLNFPDD